MIRIQLYIYSTPEYSILLDLADMMLSRHPPSSRGVIRPENFEPRLSSHSSLQLSHDCPALLY